MYSSFRAISIYTTKTTYGFMAVTSTLFILYNTYIVYYRQPFSRSVKNCITTKNRTKDLKLPKDSHLNHNSWGWSISVLVYYTHIYVLYIYATHIHIHTHVHTRSHTRTLNFKSILHISYKNYTQLSQVTSGRKIIDCIGQTTDYFRSQLNLVHFLRTNCQL